ncbi:MAG: glycosyltransferase family 4 protein [Clostridia bacterium]|nr:glycosyltransferase family 4 protein [Clostridia bacterium]
MKFSCCIFSAQFLPHIGGVEMYVQKISNQLVKCGVEVTIVTSKMKNTPSYELTDNGIEIYRMPSLQLMNTRLPVLKPCKETSQIEKKLQQKNFDLVMINTRFYPLSLFAAKFAKKNNIKSIIVEHGTDYLTVNNPIFDRIIKIYEKSITSKIKNYCSDFYGVSNACCDWLKTFGISAKGTIYNCIDTENINSLDSCVDYRHKFNIPKDALVVSFVGRAVEEKGVLQLVEAVKKINQSKPSLYLLMAGSGPLDKELSSLQDDYIKYLGSLAFSDVIALFSVCDIFCLPSRSEGFPTVVLEASYKNCYIITTDKGGAKELIINDDYGTVIKDNNSDTIMTALLDLVNNQDKIKKAAKLANTRLNENFTSEKVCENFINTFIKSEEHYETIADNTGI